MNRKKLFVFLLGTMLILAAAIVNGCTRPLLVTDTPTAEKPNTAGQTSSSHPDPQPVNNKSLAENSDSSNKTFSWYVVRNKMHRTPQPNSEFSFSLKPYHAYYLGSKDKLVFLTFDEGYENGYTAQILDTLKQNHVPAAFFVTEPYITANPELVCRMVAEGHIVGSHSKSHPSMPSLTGNPDAFRHEFTATADAFKAATGKNMPLFFRPPRGEFSEKSLAMTSELNYKTVFWSFAYEDWLTEKQPPPETAQQKILQNTHNGEIMLLHAVSETNTRILDQVIQEIIKQGYQFAPLTELEETA